MKPLHEVAISEFKAKCLNLVDRVRTTKTPLRITRHGKPIADVVPISPPTASDDWLGSMSAMMQINGDIMSPVVDETNIDALRERK